MSHITARCAVDAREAQGDFKGLSISTFHLFCAKRAAGLASGGWSPSYRQLLPSAVPAETKRHIDSLISDVNRRRGVRGHGG